MKIDISKLDLTQFMAHEHFVAGEVVTLVQIQPRGLFLFFHNFLVVENNRK
jgi:hypothetical protein